MKIVEKISVYTGVLWEGCVSDHMISVSAPYSVTALICGLFLFFMPNVSSLEEVGGTNHGLAEIKHNTRMCQRIQIWFVARDYNSLKMLFQNFF